MNNEIQTIKIYRDGKYSVKDNLRAKLQVKQSELSTELTTFFHKVDRAFTQHTWS